MHSVSDIFRLRSAGILSLLVLLSFPKACEKVIDIDIDEISPMIVLNSVITPDSTIEVSLSRTRHILDDAALNTLKGATVTISDTLGNSEVLIIGEDEIYRTTALNPQSGMKYTVRATVPDYYDVEATTTVPDIIPIAAIDTFTTISGDYWSNEFNVSFLFDDPPGVANYYMVSVVARMVHDNSYVEFLYDTVYVDPHDGYVVMGYVPDTIYSDWVEYSNVYGNVSDLLVEGFSPGDHGMFFSDKLFDGKSFRMNFSIPDYYFNNSSDTAALYIRFKSLDEHFYRYIKKLEMHYYAQDDFLATPVQMYSNISDGLGIFGSYAQEERIYKFAPVYYPYYYY